MKIVPSEFSNSAWSCFILAKEIAYKNYQQNVDSDNLLLALLKDDNITKKILKKNNVNLKDLEREIISSLNAKAKMKYKQNNLFNNNFTYHSSASVWLAIVIISSSSIKCFFP